MGSLGTGATPPGQPLLEILDRDGQARQAFVVGHWPLRIGRALDNDIVLSDPHVAPHHLVLEEHSSGIVLIAGATANGVRVGRQHLRAHEQAALDPQRENIEFSLGRIRLRLRLPEQPLAAELALAPDESPLRHLTTMLVAALLLIAGTLFTTYLNTDPDNLAGAAGMTLLTAVVAAAIWCGGWALLSKTFAHQARFGWHLRVFLIAGVALLAVDAAPELLAFAFSWPWLTDFAFVGKMVVAAGALYFHLLAVEPARRRLLRWVAAVCALVGIALTLWFNLQRSGLLGEELYMSHLFPPALRIAKPISVDAFIDGLAPLKAGLDKKAREAGDGNDADAAGAEDDE